MTITRDMLDAEIAAARQQVRDTELRLEQMRGGLNVLVQVRALIEQQEPPAADPSDQTDPPGRGPGD